MFFGFEKKKKTAEILLTSVFKMPDKTLSKEKVNLLTSGSASSPQLNSKHFAYVTQQPIAGDQDVYRMAIQNNVLCQWATLKDSQNTFRHRYVVQSGKKADESLSTSTMDRRHFVYSTSHGLSHGKMCFLSANGVQDDDSHD